MKLSDFLRSAGWKKRGFRGQLAFLADLVIVGLKIWSGKDVFAGWLGEGAV